MIKVNIILDLQTHMLVAVTEVRTKEEMDHS